MTRYILNFIIIILYNSLLILLVHQIYLGMWDVPFIFIYIYIYKDSILKQCCIYLQASLELRILNVFYKVL